MPTMAIDEYPLDVRTNPSLIDDGRGSICRNYLASHGEKELCPDLIAEAADASLLSLEPIQTSDDGADEERVAPEDWLEAMQAMDFSNTDGAFG